MADPASSQPIGGQQRPLAGIGQGPSAAAPADKAKGASFKALLEKLEQKAEALDAKARGELRPDELAAAVDDARSSLEDVLALQDQLLEAFRHSQLQKTDSVPAVDPGQARQGGK